MKVHGQTALVTGGARRIGAACVHALARAGAKVVVHAHHSLAQAQEVCREVAFAGGEARIVQGDLLDPQGVGRIMEQAQNHFGPLTILVNNAAIFEPGTVRDTSMENWHRHMEINLTTPFFLMQHFARQCPSGAMGKIVNLIDQRVLRPRGGHVAYTAAKSALWTLTRMAAMELAPEIQVNAIGPGPILPVEGEAHENFTRVVHGTPMGRPGTPEEIGETLLFLLQQDFITGEMICVDGGEHL